MILWISENSISRLAVMIEFILRMTNKTESNIPISIGVSGFSKYAIDPK